MAASSLSFTEAYEMCTKMHKSMIFVNRDELWHSGRWRRARGGRAAAGDVLKDTDRAALGMQVTRLSQHSARGKARREAPKGPRSGQAPTARPAPARTRGPAPARNAPVCLPSRRPGEARSHRVKGPCQRTHRTVSGPLMRCDSPEGGRWDGRQHQSMPNQPRCQPNTLLLASPPGEGSRPQYARPARTDPQRGRPRAYFTYSATTRGGHDPTRKIPIE